MKQNYEVIVIGGGHAGCEASLAAARMGCETLLITMDKNKTGEMSCNPSIGGVGKGQLVKEIDALGGEMGRNADFTGIQFKKLNTRKGSAVQSTRCQSDKVRYAKRMQKVTSEQSKLEILEGEVKEIVVEAGKVKGLKILTKDKGIVEIFSSQVVITAGTFMKAVMHCGFDQSEGGRFGEKPSKGLSDCLSLIGIKLLRLKTGTPARLISESIDFSAMERQDGDLPISKFSFWDSETPLQQVPCYLSYTSAETHELIRKNLSRSPLYSGMIQGIGPRYCPSIEDKVVKFPQKDRHPLFFEPESLDSNWIYPNGISTSLPKDVQEAFIRTLPGCANVEIARYGYAVEYDCIDPQQLRKSLEAVNTEGLFLGGQTNGTSGYEEAAAQGLMAGINAALKSQKKEPLILSRSESYIGVMIDDLTSQGITEPYRMFTSRAEYRLSIREDNADIRLAAYGYELGLLSEEHKNKTIEKARKIAEVRLFLSKKVIKPSPEVNKKLEECGTQPITQAMPAVSILKRPEISLSDLSNIAEDENLRTLELSIRDSVEVEVKYEGYISIQRTELEKIKKLQKVKIPEGTQFREIQGLSRELSEKLLKRKPSTIAEATQISGMTPSAISVLLFHVKHNGENHSTRRTV